MTQGKRDGKNPKFRVLCKRCNSYQYTIIRVNVDYGLGILCARCGNTAESIEEEFEEEK